MKSKSKTKFVVLDFDRTLVDLGVSWARTRQRVADECQRQGLFIEQNRSLFEIMDEAGNMAEGLFDIIKEEELLALETAKFMPGAKSFLDWLYDEKIPFAILSNNHRAVIEKAFLRFGFEKPVMVVGSDDVKRKKPHPEGMEKILRFFKASAKDGVLIGDSQVEVELGKLVEMQTLIVSPHLTFEGVKKLLI